MSLILALETSTNICSVAVWENGSLLALEESSEKNAHSKSLSVMILKLLEQNNLTGISIDAVAVSMGPGSYTGLRIGVSMAKGLCYGWLKPLIAVDTVKAQTVSFLQTEGNKYSDQNILFCPMFDARRMEVYTAIYTADLTEILPVQALVVEKNSFDEYLKTNTIVFFGNGAIKCKEVIDSPNAVFIDRIEPSAIGIAVLAEQQFKQNQFVDVAYFEPYYLKEFIAGKPSKKVI